MIHTILSVSYSNQYITIYND